MKVSKKDEVKKLIRKTKILEIVQSITSLLRLKCQMVVEIQIMMIMKHRMNMILMKAFNRIKRRRKLKAKHI